MARKKAKKEKIKITKTTKKRKKAKIININPKKLKPHPNNYRVHLDDQIQHIIKSIKNNGIYRNIVTARDFTILAGHGVVEATIKMKLKEIPIICLDIDPNESNALKILTGDNEISNLVEIDDRKLSELLKEIGVSDNLLGTGFDEKMLANLLLVTRPTSEIRNFDEAAEWVGMPEFSSDESIPHSKVIVSFRNNEDRIKFFELIKQTKNMKTTKSIWYPYKEKDDLKSISFE